MKKHLAITLGIGVPLGIFLIFLRKSLDISEKEFWSYYLIAGVVIIIGSLVVNIIWQVLFMKKLFKLTPLLQSDKNPDKYIEENEKILQQTKSPFHKSLVSMNISVGYSEKRDYKRAKEILLGIPEKHMKGIHKIIFNHNLSYYHFLLGENTQAIAVFNANRDAFRKYENHPALGGSIAVNNIYYHIAKGETEQAKLLLEQARIKYSDPKLSDDLEALTQKLETNS